MIDENRIHRQTGTRVTQRDSMTPRRETQPADEHVPGSANKNEASVVPDWVGWLAVAGILSFASSRARELAADSKPISPGSAELVGE